MDENNYCLSRIFKLCSKNNFLKNIVINTNQTREHHLNHELIKGLSVRIRFKFPSVSVKSFFWGTYLHNMLLKNDSKRRPILQTSESPWKKVKPINKRFNEWEQHTINRNGIIESKWISDRYWKLKDFAYPFVGQYICYPTRPKKKNVECKCKFVEVFSNTCCKHYEHYARFTTHEIRVPRRQNPKKKLKGKFYRVVDEAVREQQAHITNKSFERLIVFKMLWWQFRQNRIQVHWTRNDFVVVRCLLK